MKHVKGSDLSTALAGNLKRLRTRKKLTLRAAGSLAGLSGVYIWQIEAGIRAPTLVAVQKLADALGVKVADLLKPLPPVKAVKTSKK